MRPESRVLLIDVREAARFIADDTANATYEAFVADQRMRQAVLYSFLVIGEALNRIHRRDPDLAQRTSDIGDVVAMRNVVIHGYDIVDFAIVWRAVQEKLPALALQIEEMLLEDEQEYPGLEAT
ncbi:MAG: HepT-like ribonuclease domain-containing protein [Thermomicrobiales bacterium]